MIALQHRTATELEDGNYVGKRYKIDKALKLLEDKGFISVHKNPSQKHGYDQTRHFMYHAALARAYIKNEYLAEKTEKILI